MTIIDVCTCVLTAWLLAGPVPMVDGGFMTSKGCKAEGKYNYTQDGVLRMEMKEPLYGWKFEIRMPPLYENTDFEWCIGTPVARIGSALVAVKIIPPVQDQVLMDKMWMKEPPPWPVE